MSRTDPLPLAREPERHDTAPRGAPAAPTPVDAPASTPSASGTLPVHVIALREEQFAEAAAAAGAAGFVNVHWLRAVDGRAVDLNDRDLVSAEAAYDLREGRVSHAQLPSRGAVGCYLSHVAAWRIAQAGTSPVLVLEEDARWRSVGGAAALLASFVDALAAVDVEWDVLQIGGFQFRARARLLDDSARAHAPPSHAPDTSNGSGGAGGGRGAGSPAPPPPRDAVELLRRAWRITGQFFGTEGYVITPEGASKMLRCAMPVVVQVDAKLAIAASLGDISMVAPQHALAYQAQTRPSLVQRRDGPEAQLAAAAAVPTAPSSLPPPPMQHGMFAQPRERATKFMFWSTVVAALALASMLLATHGGGASALAHHATSPRTPPATLARTPQPHGPPRTPQPPSWTPMGPRHPR